VSIPGELARARRLAFASDEASARDLLLSLVPQVEEQDRDDLMLEVLAQLGEIYLARGAHDGVQSSIRRIEDCVAIYTEIGDDANARMICRYARRAQFLRVGLAAAQGDHDGAATGLATLDTRGADGDFADLADEHSYLLTYARVLCATALCDDDLHARSVPVWEQVRDAVDQPRGDGEFTDHLLVTAATAYGRFCVATGRLAEAEPWLRRAGARAQQKEWELATARTQLERAAACWSVGDHVSTEQLVSQAHPVITRYARAHDVARCWLYLGLTRMASGALEAADECFEQAEQQWRELGKPLPLHRILLQRSWIPIFCSRFGEAVELIAQARELLDSSPRSSWLQYAQLDNHLGTVWRADALADLGFDSSGDPDETLEETEARQAEGLGILRGEVGTPAYFRGLTKLEQAAELKIPAALAVDSVRYSITDADARSRWASRISAPILAGAFAVAWEWENTGLISELVEYHSARGTFNAEPQRSPVGEWGSAATAPVLLDAGEALAAAGPPAQGAGSLTRLGPLPPLQMQPDAAPIMSHYRALALARYGRDVTAAEPAWSTWP
ncbi:tetratricopeptide repeat family protein, partial [Mycobacterium numidiamassiliense]